jgi:hypothetical protein
MASFNAWHELDYKEVVMHAKLEDVSNYVALNR